MKNNPIAFDELGNQIAKLDGSPLPQNNNWEEEFNKEFPPRYPDDKAGFGFFVFGVWAVVILLKK